MIFKLKILVLTAAALMESLSAALAAETDQSTSGIVQAELERWMAQDQPPGAIVVVRRDGKTEFFPVGKADPARDIPVDADTIFELASITKSFVATSLAIEVEQGRMQLGDPIDKYLPALRAGGDIRRVTLAQLATHSAGLPRTPGAHPSGRWNPQRLTEWLVGWQATEAPGAKWLYSNVAFGVLGDAIVELEHQPLQAVLDRQFLHPLGMRSTFFEIPESEQARLAQGVNAEGDAVARSTAAGAWPASWRLCSSGRDMGRFLAANLGEDAEHPAIVKAMQLTQRPYFKASAELTQGLSWQRVNVSGELIIDKHGDNPGCSTYMGMLPERKIGIVILANRGKCDATAFGRRLLLQLCGSKAGAENPQRELK